MGNYFNKLRILGKAYIKKNMNTYSCLKPYGFEPWYLVCSITLFDLYKVCSNVAPVAQNGQAPGSHILNRLI